ncbi:hypothetical protein [Oleiharenicola lentus]|uniref:hypothetical protein n=1 Tax=Oleiharenicola lentus TaxID=2508720 RepID=UPI003F6644C3
MSEGNLFDSFPCSLGLVVGFSGTSYLIDSPSHGIIGIPSATTPNEANVESDIASAQPPPLTPAQIYAAQLAVGFLDADTGVKLKTTERARSMFTSQATLIQLALGVLPLEARAPFLASPQQIWDFNDEEQTLSTADLIGLLLRYGQHWQTLFNQYAP